MSGIRKEFEAWANQVFSIGFKDDDACLLDRDGAGYEHMGVNGAWAAWEHLATSMTAQHVAELEQAIKNKEAQLAAPAAPVQKPMTGAKLAEGMTYVEMDIQFLPVNHKVPNGDRCAYTLGSVPLYKLAEAVNAVMAQPAPGERQPDDVETLALAQEAVDAVCRREEEGVDIKKWARELVASTEPASGERQP